MRWNRRLLGFLMFVPLASCGTPPNGMSNTMGLPIVPPTPALTSSTLSLVNPTRGVMCSGTYDTASSASQLSVPITCSDGRSGIILYSPSVLDRQTGYGTVNLSDGRTDFVQFGSSGPDQATGVLKDYAFSDHERATPSSASSTSIASASPNPDVYTQPNSAIYTSTGSSSIYSGNCPTPESLDSAGRRCGLRSAASRPGGYNGYGGYTGRSYSSRSSGGTTHVRGYFRKDGTYVRSHTRRR